MRTFITSILLVTFFGFSCSNDPKRPSDQSETLKLTSETMRKMVDLQLSDAIWTDEQRGRNNEELIAKLKQLAKSRKGLNFEDLSAVEAHVSILKSLQKDIEDVELQSSMDRMEEYLAVCQSDPENLPLLQSELGNIEFVLSEHWSRQLGVVDCCFPSPMSVQTNKEVSAGEPFEMVIFPQGERAMWEQVSYSYEKVYIEQAGNKVPVQIESKRIGHALILEFKLQDSGAYNVHFSVTEDGEYLAEPWQQDFEWTVVVL